MNIKELAIYITEHSGDIGTLTAPELEYELLIRQLDEMVSLQAQIRDVYFEGWSDGKNTTTVDGDPTHDWVESETAKQLKES